MPVTAIVTAVAATAASTLVVAGIFFLIFYKLAMARKPERGKFDSSFRREGSVLSHRQFIQQGGAVKGLAVDESGLDVLYLREPENVDLKRCFSKIWVNPMVVGGGGEENSIDRKADKSMTPGTIQEIQLLHDSSNTANFATQVSKTGPLIPKRQTPPPAPPPPPPPPPPPSPPPPPLPPRPLPPPLLKKAPAPPPLPPNSAKRNPAPPPPPPGKGGLVSSLKPPPVPRGKTNSDSRGEAPLTGESSAKGVGDVKLKLKPLHWDKVTANVDHSMVWDQINLDGSFRFDDELMESLFGYTQNNQKPTGTSRFANLTNPNSASSRQIFILDPRKSQNTAIVLRSLSVSRKEILDSLLEGRGLSPDTLEKLTKISPTQEESSKILQFNGSPTKLADAESFLYQILKPVPSAFTRFNAMLFRSNYDSEILHLKESIHTLELGCKELRNQGIFFKLLQAILKAGNRMNAGTNRGNAQGFNLTALRKLSHVKSTDGKTTLLHFVVEQVARSEGKRKKLNQSPSFGTSDYNPTKRNDFDGGDAREEYLQLGLPALETLNADFTNVKKSAVIDYDGFINACSNLTARACEIRVMEKGESGGFVREMKGFLEECEEEIRVVREEQVRVMEVVSKTTKYYQAGGEKERGGNPLQLFGIVKDFLGMVEGVRVEIGRGRREKGSGRSGARLESGLSSPPQSPPPLLPRTPVRAQNFRVEFMGGKAGGSGTSSESDGDFSEAS
ncbi:hypothetical protein RHGRI_024283 [Rhododendron griersonianum]|uniref:Formin-like protein n=1 Tax=Rhododendron griersonianum TaxID=479676 RepID=A0AAV6J6N4_9ERIC|nr:hypothetical protein RHGRI_024283 [Rhododendron griersonianum]